METKKREFGKNMAKEGMLSNIPTIIRIMYSVLIFYSILASFFTGDAYCTQIIFYFVILALFYFWHWLAHQKFMGKMHKIHNEHHYLSFPPNKFYGSEGTTKKVYGHDIPTFWQLMDPRISTNFNLVHEGILYLLILIITLIIKIILGYSNLSLFFFLLMATIMGSVGSALHSSFHVKGFELERYQWYLELRTLHYIHHLGNTQHNFGVLNLGALDGIFGTMSTQDPRREKNIKDYVLPEGIDINYINLVNENAGSISKIALFTNNFDTKNSNQDPNLIGMYPTVLLRLIIIGFGFWFWYKGSEEFLKIGNSLKHFEDLGHFLTFPLQQFILRNNMLQIICNIQYLLSDLMTIHIILISIFNKSTKPVLTVIFCLMIRMIFQLCTPFIPISPNFIETNNTLPTLFGNTSTLVSYFNPHIIVTTTYLLEMFNFSTNKKIIFVLIFQILVVLTLQTNWTIDIITIIIITIMSSQLALKFSKYVDYINSF